MALRLFLATLVSVLWAASTARADLHQPAEGRTGCPHCRADGSEIARSLQKADILYADFKSTEALRELLKVLEVDPDHHEALSKSSRVHIDLGDTISESEPGWRAKRLRQYRTAEQYARRAIEADPTSTWGHFYVAASLGKIAMHSPLSEQVDLAREIQTEVENAIRLDPRNGFAYHIYGVWHRRVAEIGQMKRLLSSVVFGRSVPEGSLKKSVDYLSKAVSLNPAVISHRLELAKSYMGLGKLDLARDLLESAQELPVRFSDDPIHKEEAGRLLQEIDR